MVKPRVARVPPRRQSVEESACNGGSPELAEPELAEPLSCLYGVKAHC